MAGILSKLIGEDALPVGLVAGLAISALVLNIPAGLNWTPNLATLMVLPVSLLGLAAYYRLYRAQMPAIADGLLYFSLWSIYSIFAVRLTYLGLLLNFPLRDSLFIAADAALGFHWEKWARFVVEHPIINLILAKSYETNGPQIMAAVVILAIWRPGRNRELMIAITLAIIITLTICTILPAKGVAEQYGFHTAWGPVIDDLRSGKKGPFPYAGIIFFPSFHTVTAVLLIIAVRGISLAFWSFVAINALLIVSVPFSGGHYLVDVISGTAVALLSQWAAARLLPPTALTLAPAKVQFDR